MGSGDVDEVVVLGGYLFTDLVVGKGGFIHLGEEFGGVLIIDPAQGDRIGEDVVDEVVVLLGEGGLLVSGVALSSE